MNYKLELQKEFSKMFSETTLEFLINETDLALTDENIDEAEEENVYYQYFLKTIHKFVFGKYNNYESKNYLNNYLNNILTKNISDVKKLKLICDFYRKIIATPEIEHIIDLLNNNVLFYSCIENIYFQNKDLILKDLAEKILNDDIFIQFIDIYLDLNNIEKENESNYEVELDQLPQFDATRMLMLDLYKYPVLTHEQIIKLFKDIENGDIKAKNKIIEHNLRLVLNIAKRYVSDKNHILDLFQEGALGLDTAVDRFDYKKGYKFSTYATQWIRQGITRYVMDKSYTIRVPVYLRYEQIKFKKVYNEIKIQLGKDPTIEEIAENSEYNIKTIKKLMNLPDELKSLNERVKDDEDSEFGDFIDGDVLNTEEETERRDLSNKIQEWLNTYLTPKEKFVLIGRMGLDGNKPRTLEDIGQEIGVTRERIRQIELKCLKKLRRSKMATNFIDYMKYPNQAQQFLQEFSKTGPTTKPIPQNKFGLIPSIPTTNPTKLIKGEKNMDVQLRQNKMEENPNYKSRKNLYKYFSYSEEELDKVIEGLEEKEKLLLKQIYGSDLKNPVKYEVIDKDKTSFYGLIKKIKRRLEKKSGKKVIESKRIIKIYDRFSNYPEELIDKAVEALTEAQKQCLKSRYGDDLKNPQIKPYSDKNGSQAIHYIMKRIENNLKKLTLEHHKVKNAEIEEKPNKNITELYDNLYFLNLIRELPIKESTIMFLRKNYSNQQIADALNISAEEVIEISKNAILQIKTMYNNIFNEEVKSIEREQKTKIKQ